MTDWIDNELRHDGALDEEPPSAEEQAQIDAEATAAAENADEVFRAQDDARKAEDENNKVIREAFARLAEVQTVTLRRQDWNTIMRTLREKEERLRRPGTKGTGKRMADKRQASELAVLATQIETWIEINEKTIGPLTKA